MDQTTLTNPSGDVIQLTSPAQISIRDVTVMGSGMDIPRNGIEVRDGVTLTLENCRIRNSYYGLRLLRDDAVASVSNLVLEGNYYAIMNFGSLSITSSTLRGNQIGLSNVGTVAVVDTIFDSNGHFDPSSGAASPTINNGPDGQLTITEGRVSNSSGYGIIVNGGSVLLDGLEVNDNLGIAIWHMQGTLEIRSSIVRDNGAYGLAVGGWRSVADIGTVNVHETAIVRNGSAGVRIDGGDVTLQNVTVSGNVATSSGGGGIWMYGGNLFLLNSTVAFNTGHGIEAGPGDEPAVITARRSVVALNSTEECQLDSRVSTTYGTSSFMCTESYTTLTLGLGPLTAEASTLVHPLQSGSPLIDAGGPLALCATIDQRGFGRPAGFTCDVGAYEFGTSAAAIVIATPGQSETPDIIPLITATPAPVLFTFIQNANCRKGPSSQYDIIVSVQQGQEAEGVGRNEQSDWWLVDLLEVQMQCWVAASTVEGSGALDLLQVETALPVANTPGQFVAGQTVCSQNLNYYSVPLGWSDVNNETGYRIYRNGTLLVTLAVNTVAYEDHAPKGIDLLYQLEVFNNMGVSDKVQVSLPACP
ncbi:MAG: right-handed parallel beta-helix repeat-containing protein [Chloroflexi bacterium]|nr:right-handed parallel beta-helix repeat-containing protein [Chloroflexota bacterium]